MYTEDNRAMMPSAKDAYINMVTVTGSFIYMR